MNKRSPSLSGAVRALCAILASSAIGRASADEPPRPNRSVIADVVALDQPFLWNRLGTSQPGGMVYALRGDVVSCDPGGDLRPGRVMLRPGKRPRPLVLRADVGDELVIRFTNLLSPAPAFGSAVTRYAGVHVNGLDLARDAGSDASWVGRNPDGLAAPGESRTYRYLAKAEGTFLLDNAADNAESQQSAGFGLFGAVNVEPEWAEWYRSQVTRDDLFQATKRVPGGPGPLRSARLQYLQEPAAGGMRSMRIRGADRQIRSLQTVLPDKNSETTTDVVVIDGRMYTTLDQPLIDYESVYESGPSRGLPVLGMLQARGGPGGFETDPLTFNPAQVDEAIREFNSSSSLVTPALVQVFDGRGIALTTRARVTAEAGYTWLITEPGRGQYLVERVEPRPGAPAFRVSPATLHIVHSDLTAVITGPDADRFDFEINSPSFFINPTLPDRRQPFREFTIIYHQASAPTQAFANYFNVNLRNALGAGDDNFAINYGMAGIGSEILASRLGVGPMGNKDAVDLKYEEFFLSSWAVGDPAMVVDVPANAANQAVTDPEAGSRATQQLLFTLEENEAVDQVMQALANGVIAPKLLAGFKARGVALDHPFATVVLDQNQWVIVDPFDLNNVPPPDRKRYPILRLKDVQEHGGNVTTLGVYAGFPAAPSPFAFNQPEGVPAADGSRPVKATKAFFPDDPSNVYHSNIRDHVKFRLLHAGPGPSHVHHLHAHQWLHSPDSAQAQYLDSQLIIPGATYTLEMVYNGSGNRNLTVGDSIFHCHFYPHFAQGMWSLWRTHDVFETGTWLDVAGRPVTHVTEPMGRETPAYRYLKDKEEHFYYYDDRKNPHEVAPDRVHRAWNRALPDGEIEAGTPVPAIVPLPSIAMPPMPARVRLTGLAPLEDGGQGRRVEVEPRNAAAIALAEADRARGGSAAVPGPDYENPGYPFFIPGVSGHRPPHPPMDFGWKENEKGEWLDAQGRVTKDPTRKVPLDGGLPRHVVLGGKIVKEYHTRWDFTRDFVEYDKDGKVASGALVAMRLPEGGTPYEKAAMRHHSQRTHASFLPSGDPGNITRNGLKARPGAPYAPPEVDDYGNAEFNARRYQAAVIQTDVVLNKLGWHFPQQRFLTLWEDVGHTIGGRRAPQPLFFRSNTNDTIEFWHTNLVPSVYELDDFQVRTPTDVIGQHIHNVKFDVTSSDGGANGFNYEDGTFSPDEVRDRIAAIDATKDPINPKFAAEAGLLQFDDATGFVAKDKAPERLEVVKVKDAYPPRAGAGDPEHGLFGKPPRGQVWDGAQTTVQRWDTDPLLDIYGEERTLRTIFTHDHLGPSTHQQVGLYAGLVVEPEGSHWYLPEGDPMYERRDGGPTSWQGYVVTRDPEKSYREFAVEFQDTQLAYNKSSIALASNARFDPSRPGSSAVFDVAQYGQAASNQSGQLIRQQIGSTFVKDLDNETLPRAFVSTIFPGMGIPLTGKEKVTRVRPGQAWRIDVPDGAGINEGAAYELRLKGTDSLLVYTPGIHPGWSDAANALNPPGGGPNGFLGAPFPQLISSGPIGTYSMNYRNESVLARVATRSGAAPAPAGPGAVPSTIEVDGVILNGTPTWVVGGRPAASVAIKPGDTVVWKAASGTHGVVFDSQAAASPFLQFATGGGLPTLGPVKVDGQDVWGTVPQMPGTVLARATVRAGLKACATLGFFCSQHGRAMSGTLDAPGVVPTEEADLASVFKSIPRAIEALNVQPAPGTPIDPTASIEVDGVILNGTPTWVVGGRPAASVAIKPGDTVVWKAASGTHGVVFDTEAAAAPFLQFQAGGGLPALGPVTVQGENVWGSTPQPSGTVLARAVVRPGVPSGADLGFFCSQHGRAMSGSMIAAIEIDGVILDGKPTWVLDGRPASEVVVKPGDTVVWKAASGTHGVVFDTEATAGAVLQFATGGGLPALGPVTVKGENVWGTAPQPQGTVLARATVKAGVGPGADLGFFCSQHGRAMSGSMAVAYFTFPPYVVRPSTPTEPGGVEPTDPFTPLMRAYANDRVEVRTLVGAHTLAHSFQIQGVRWEFEPDYPDSGYKNAQAMGISEHFEMIFSLPPSGARHDSPKLPSFADYLLSPSSSVDGLANGNWTILRAFTEQIGERKPGRRPSPNYLAPLPSNPLVAVDGGAPGRDLPSRRAALDRRFQDVAAEFQTLGSGGKPGFRRLRVTATTAAKAYGGPISFNPRARGPYDLKDMVVFVRTDDLGPDGRVKAGTPIEPLILRVAAGDWVEVQLTNALGDDPSAPGIPCPQDLGAASPFLNPNALPAGFTAVPATSRQAGLHPALVSFDVTKANGVNVGFNPDSTVKAGPAPATRAFYWYAGEILFLNGLLTERPVEFGATNLVPGDLMIQPQFGMVGALVVEPRGSTWTEDPGTYASATVRPVVPPGMADPKFREFVLVGQNVVANGGFGAFNYRTETFDSRNFNPAATSSQLTATRALDFRTGAGVAPLGPVTINKASSGVLNGVGYMAETAWGTNPKPATTVLAQSTVKALPAGTKLGFFCSQHGRAMSGSLAVGAAAGAPSTVTIDGAIVGGTPTWVIGGTTAPAVDVPVKPGDTVVWRAVGGTHGVVFDPSTPGVGYALAFSNDALVPSQDPKTPIFTATAGEPVRFRLVMPSTSTSNGRVPPVTFDIHGHGWPEEPYANEGAVIGGWPANTFALGSKLPPMNWRSQYMGSQQVAVYEAFNFVIDHAGGRAAVPGDYLYEAYQQSASTGMWGIFRVVPPGGAVAVTPPPSPPAAGPASPHGAGGGR